jgi:hypothetical protein
MTNLNIAILGVVILTASSCGSKPASEEKSISSAQAPTATLIGSTTGTGTTGTFTARFENASGAAALNSMGILIHDSLSHDHACYVYYDNTAHQVTLMDDVKTLWLPGAAVGSPGKVENSQCSVDAGQSAVTVEPKAITVKAAVTFKPTFTGDKKVYLYAANTAGLNSGYVLSGGWLIGKSN